MHAKWAKIISLITLMVFIWAMAMPLGSCLGAQTEIFYKVQDTTNDRIYPADRGKKIDTMDFQTAWSFDKESIIELTLSDGVYWYMDNNYFKYLDIPSLDLLGFSPDRKTMRIEVIDNDCDQIDLTDFKVATLPGVPIGDIVVTVGGDFSASLVVGAVLASADIRTTVPLIDNKSSVAGDITFTETYRDSLHPVDNPLGTPSGEWYIGLTLPEGVSFAAEPRVAVNGISVSSTAYLECFRERKSDIFRGARRFEPGSRECYIKINQLYYFGTGKESVTLSNLQYQVASDFTGWDIAVAVSGDMVNKLLGAGNTLVPNLEKDHLNGPVYSVVNATTEKVVSMHGEMTMGSLRMSINGKDLIMDVTPYIQDNRTYLPVRYAAYVLGLHDDDIAWDGATQTVTLTRGTTQVKMKVGSQTLWINGSEVLMDAAPQIKADRVCLPIRYVAEAFGASVAWNPLTLTVTIEL